MPPSTDLPKGVVETAVASLLKEPPNENKEILYIGNTEPLIDAIREYCEEYGCPQPTGLAVELDSERLKRLRDQYATSNIQFVTLDFLTADLGKFDYILADPPRIAKHALNAEKETTYRDHFLAATGRFDTASLFLEHALNHLAETGRLTIVMSNRFETAESDRSLRHLLANEYHIERIHEFDSVFEQSVPFVVMTVVNDSPGITQTSAGEVYLPNDGSGWSQAIQGVNPPLDSEITLEDICQRVGAGIATGADGVFIMDKEEVPPQLEEWTRPVIGGRELSAYDDVKSNQVVICPYTSDGQLVSERELGADFHAWAELHRETLKERAHIEDRGKPWYAWIRDPPLDDILQPKILTRDFANEIKFWADNSGEFIPRRTVYYIVPQDQMIFNDLFDYLNSSDVQEWLEATSRRTEERGYRLTTRDLLELPVPNTLT